MKLKKIFAGMAASAIAMTTMAIGAPVSASADTVVTGNAGISFQTGETWNYRNVYAAADQTAAFPAGKVGVQGGAYGIDENLVYQDTAINGDGTYTVSINTSGTITAENPEQEGYYLNEDKTLSRSGSAWSMLKNTEPAESEDSNITQDQIQWKDGKTTDKFNMLMVTTDIPCEYNDDNKPVVNGEVLEVTDVTVDMCGTTYNATGDTMYQAQDSEDGNQYVTIALINTYADSTIDPAALPASDGTITVTFTVKGLGGGDSEDSSSEEDTSSGDSSTGDSSSAASNNNNNNGGGSSNKGSSGGSTTKTTTTTTSTTESLSSGASDATENAESGAPAGIALALAAVAGAVVVVSKKR